MSIFGSVGDFVKNSLTGKHVRTALNGPADGPKARPSAQDIALAHVAGLKDQNFEQNYLPLEIQNIESARDPATRAVNEQILAGRHNADVASAEDGALAAARARATATGTNLRSGANVSALRSAQDSVALGLSAGAVDASKQASDIQDNSLLNVIRTGRGQSAATTSSLAQLARQQNYTGAARVAARQQEQMAQNGAIAQLAVTGAYGGYRSFRDAGNTDLASADISPFAKLLRGSRDPKISSTAPISTLRNPYGFPTGTA